MAKVKKYRVNADGSMTISIDDDEKTYDVAALDPSPEVGSPAYRLTKRDGSGSHDVILTAHGPECSCGDFNFRRRNEKIACKHIETLRARGFLGDRR